MINENLKDTIIGSRNIKSISVMILLIVGGSSFFLAGLGSYYKLNIFFDLSTINYIPQGILMLFYGTLALTFALYLALTIIWNVGSGYNQFLKEEEIIYIIRRSFPGKNRLFFLSYPFKIVKQIKLLKKDGINPRTNIILVLKDKREIPLYPPQFLLKPSEIEKKAIYISNLLKVPLETKNVS